MSKYKYSESEQETLKVLKMQEDQLNRLEVDIHEDIVNSQKDADDLADLRRRTETLLRKRGITPLPKQLKLNNTSIKVNKEEIPTWENLAKKANSQYMEEVSFEDLLSKKEFQFCIDEVQRINDEFSRKTGILNKKDMSFLIVATVLQTVRWLIIQELCGDLGQSIDSSTRISDKEGNKLKHSPLSKFQEKVKEHANVNGKYPSWEEILWGTYPRTDGGKTKGHCPYDAQSGAPSWFEDGGRGSHRNKTLGHDAVVGWLFGTANIMTQTITLIDFSSYHVTYPGNCFGTPVNTITDVLGGAVESTMEDWLRLPAAVVAHYAHLKSDIFTKAGLPVPLVGITSKDLAGKLYKEQYDALCLLKDVAIVGSQAAFSILINMLISLVHGLLYNPEIDDSRDLYEVRTRKILLISNSLASAGNIAYAIGTEDWRKLDIGGIMVTLYRLFSDIRFISKIKKEFIENEMDKVLAKEIKELDSYFEN